jgi:hypothetical protein
MMTSFLFDSFSSKISSNKTSLVVFGTESFTDPLDGNLSKLSSSINYMYITPKNSKKLQENLKIKSLPAIRLYYGDLELFSEFSFPFKQIKNINAEFEIAEFLKRKLRNSILSETTQKTKLYQSMIRSLKMSKGFLIFIFDSRLPFCDVQIYSKFSKLNPKTYPELGTSEIKTYKRKSQKMFITLSRILSPLPSYFIRNHTNLQSHLPPSFDGVDLSSSFLQKSPHQETYAQFISDQFQSINIEDASIETPLKLCQGLFYFKNSVNSLHPISLLDVLLQPDDMVSPIIRVRDEIKKINNDILPRFPYANYNNLFQQTRPQFLFVNMDFINSMMNSNTRASLENNIKSLSKQNISKYIS